MDIDNILNTINKNLTKIDNYIDKIVTDILFIKVSDKSTQTECICCKICCKADLNWISTCQYVHFRYFHRFKARY